MTMIGKVFNSYGLGGPPGFPAFSTSFFGTGKLFMSTQLTKCTRFVATPPFAPGPA
jgi:hypothetical protein